MGLHSKLSSALRDQKTLPWLPKISEDLVNSAWEALYAESGYTQQTYSTSRIIEKNVHAKRNVLGTLVFDNFESEVILEKLSVNNEAGFEELGLCFGKADQSAIEYQLSELQLAFNLIAKIPSLFITVLTLVRSIHILSAESDQHDVSFSDPTIPFSIFISMPSVHETNSSIRLAEAIIHEAMHLQLTLIERLCPLILEDNKKLFSPWKNEDRKPSGVLHALYVFSVIYVALPLILPANNKFIVQRRSDIEDQVLKIGDFRLLNGLSLLGQLFRNNLFSYFDEHLVSDSGSSINPLGELHDSE